MTSSASEAQENLLSHVERTRRTSNEHARAEALVNDSLGTLEQAVRDAAAATHSLTCRGTGQRVMREATDLIGSGDIISRMANQ